MSYNNSYADIISPLLLILLGLIVSVGTSIWAIRTAKKDFEFNPFDAVGIIIISSFPLLIAWCIGFSSLKFTPYRYIKKTETIELSEQMPKNLNYVSQKVASIPSKQFSYLDKKGEQKTLELNESSRIFWKQSDENKLVVTTKTNYSIFSKKLGTEIYKLTVYYTE